MKDNMSAEQINLIAKTIDKVFNEHQKTLVIISMLSSCNDGDYGKIISQLERFEKIFTKF